MRDVRALLRDWLAEFNAEANHMHLPDEVPARGDRPGQKPQGGVVLQAAAGVPGPAQALLAGERLWSGSYFTGSAGGAPITVLRQYIEQQEPPARPRPGPSAFTTGLKADALADILCSAPRLGPEADP